MYCWCAGFHRSNAPVDQICMAEFCGPVTSGIPKKSRSSDPSRFPIPSVRAISSEPWFETCLSSQASLIRIFFGAVHREVAGRPGP